MDQQQAAEVLRNLALHAKRVEQILPDLPTRQEVRDMIDASIRAAVAPLPTREEMHEAIERSVRAAVAPLPTRAEMHEAIDRSVQAAVAPLATKQELSEAVGKLATRQELSQAVAKLATKQELSEAVAKLATKQELSEAVATLATKRELADTRDELCRRMDVLAERLHDEVRFSLEAMGITGDKLTRNHEAVRARLEELIRTEAQHYVAGRKSWEELREYWERRFKEQAGDLAAFRKKVDRIRAAHAAKAGGKPPGRRKVS